MYGLPTRYVIASGAKQPSFLAVTDALLSSGLTYRFAPRNDVPFSAIREEL